MPACAKPSTLCAAASIAVMRSVRLDRALETQLAPGLVHGGGGRVGQVHRAARRDHGDANLLGDAWVIDVLRWQASGLGAEEEDVAFLELDVGEPLVGVRGECEDARTR